MLLFPWIFTALLIKLSTLVSINLSASSHKFCSVSPTHFFIFLFSSFVLFLLYFRLCFLLLIYIFYCPILIFLSSSLVSSFSLFLYFIFLFSFFSLYFSLFFSFLFSSPSFSLFFVYDFTSDVTLTSSVLYTPNHQCVHGR